MTSTRWTWLGALAVLAAAAVAGALLLRSDSEDAPPPVRFGFNNNAVAEGIASPEQTAALIASLGGRIDRVQLGWDRLEPRRGDHDWSLPDAIYAADREHGIQPLFNLAFAPEWANGGVCPEGVPGCHAAPTAEHFGDYARTAAALARRYPEAVGIEVWNEPNLPYFWNPQPDPAAYSELLEVTYRAVKAAAPKMTVAGGATASSEIERPGQFLDVEFLREIERNGALDAMDAVSLHAPLEQHDPTAGTAVLDVEEVREALPSGGDLPLWVTETGITTTGERAISPAGQGLAAINLSERLPEIPGVEMVLIHTLVDASNYGPTHPETGYGVVAPDLSPKPAFCAVARAWGGEACP
ncbi:MAG: GH39 family glycosyl hydrolase [Solirubrobacterales bacterium]